MQVLLSLNLAPYVDYTDSVDVTSLKRNISLNGDNDPQRGQTGEIEMFGAAYTLVYNNLINSANLYSNAIYVRVVDTDCTGNTYDFKIDNKALKWCDNNECRVQFSMEEYTPALDCIKNTAIADNTNGEFQAYPVSGTPHPRFRYCDVMKPTFVFGMLITIANAIDAILIVLNAIVAAINALISIVGGTPIGYIPYVFSLVAGCRFGWPAPFIRTYIANACTLCGVYVDQSTVPIFFDTTDPLNPLASNYYYDACLLTAYTKKGVEMAGAKDYIDNNRPSWTLFDAMSKLKKPWNARWYLKAGKLFMHRRDLLSGLIYGSTYGIDLTGSDAQYVLGDVCFSWNGQGKPKRIYVKWNTDVSDNIGNQLLNRFNGEYLDISGNPNYTAQIEEVMADFGAASFVLDGDDSIYDANILNAIGSAFSPIQYEYRLKTQGDTLAIAKILIWDGIDMDDARAIRATYSSYTGCAEFSDDDGPFFPVTAGDLRHVNFPMSFSPCQSGIVGNLWEYWKIEKPDAGKKTNIGFEFKLNYCCAYNTLDLYMRVLFADGVTEGEISSIDFDHGSREITIKGNLV